MLKKDILNVYSHKYTKIKINLYHDFPYLSNKNNNYYYSQEFLEKCSYK